MLEPWIEVQTVVVFSIAISQLSAAQRGGVCVSRTRQIGVDKIFYSAAAGLLRPVSGRW